MPLLLKNNFSENIESARAVVFLLDEQGKMLGQGTRWIIGGTKDQPPLRSKGETVFNFVISSGKPFATTNLTTKVNFTRVILEGGKIADVTKDVIRDAEGKIIEVVHKKPSVKVSVTVLKQIKRDSVGFCLNIAFHIDIGTAAARVGA